MGRFRNSGDDEVETAIDMSPLIDCVFILLIFFIVTTVFVEETGVEVDKPQAAASSKLESNSILIAITESGEVIYAKRNIGVRGVGSIVKRMLQAEPETPVIVQGDKGAKLGILVQVVGEAKAAGALQVNIATQMGS
ncbi:MAG: biopolymer transport protein ExbD [Planctomycetota bacterium]|jgi:biopolymer transport protein ExbD